MPSLPQVNNTHTPPHPHDAYMIIANTFSKVCTTVGIRPDMFAFTSSPVGPLLLGIHHYIPEHPARSAIGDAQTLSSSHNHLALFKVPQILMLEHSSSFQHINFKNWLITCCLIYPNLDRFQYNKFIHFTCRWFWWYGWLCIMPSCPYAGLSICSWFNVQSYAWSNGTVVSKHLFLFYGPHTEILFVFVFEVVQ